ncbi:MAG: hypothetical protein ACSHYA_13010 [Opitutaceae bacterium]
MNLLAANINWDIVGIVIGILIIVVPWFFKKVRAYAKSFLNSLLFRNGFPDRGNYFKIPKHDSGSEYAVDEQQLHLTNNSSAFAAYCYQYISFYRRSTSKSITKKSESDQPTKIKTTIDFFRHSVVPFSLNFSSKLLGVTSTEADTSDIIVKQLMQKLFAKNEPATITVVGQIGCGKTTLISAIIHALYLKYNTGQHPVLTMPVMIDVREHFKPALKAIAKNKNITEHGIKLKLDEALFKILKVAYKDNQIPGFNKADSYFELFQTTFALNIRPVIIFDELDVVYYDFCKCALTPKTLRQKERYKFFHVLNFFNGFASREIQQGTFYAPVVIVALRETTFKLFNESENLTGADLDLDNNVIRLDRASNGRFCNMLVKRFEMKLKLLRTKPDIADEEFENIEISIQILKSNNQIFDDNISLSVHGLRHLMNLFNKMENYDINSRLLHHLISKPNSLFLVFQFIDGAPKYSQTTEGVSNIFLVNVDYKKEHLDADDEIVADSIDETYVKEHLHSYFLKYYLMVFINQYHLQRKSYVSLPDILRVFCKSEDPDTYTFYEKEIVHLALLHATEARHGRLVLVENAVESSDAVFVPAPRLERMFERDMFWRFEYLMVVIEDRWLGVPEMIEYDFKISYSWQRCHHFVVMFLSHTSQDKMKFVKYKLELVLKFFLVLEESHRSEMIRCKSAFDSFSAEFESNDLITDFGLKLKILRESAIEYIAEIIGEDHSDVVNELIEEIYSSKELRKTLRKHFEEYHGGMCLISMDDRMMQYHGNRCL